MENYYTEEQMSIVKKENEVLKSKLDKLKFEFTVSFFDIFTFNIILFYRTIKISPKNY
jgi:hypothetical protein